MTTLVEKYGPYALIAGASEGIGKAFATKLAGQGLHLILVARNASNLVLTQKELADKYPVEVHTIRADLSTTKGREAIISQTTPYPVGLVVYNAAYSTIAPFADTALEDHEKVLSTNCTAPLHLLHHYTRQMKRHNKGGIIMVSSLAGYQGTALIAQYAATKAYGRILAEGLWEELRHDNIDVISVSAGATETPNYVKSQPVHARFGPPVLSPAKVADTAIAALSKKPVVIPGKWNRLAALVMQRLFSRRKAIEVISANTRKMYRHRN